MISRLSISLSSRSWSKQFGECDTGYRSCPIFHAQLIDFLVAAHLVPTH